MSEKFWGAFVTIVRATATKRDKQIKTHDGSFDRFIKSFLSSSDIHPL